MNNLESYFDRDETLKYHSVFTQSRVKRTDITLILCVSDSLLRHLWTDFDETLGVYRVEPELVQNRKFQLLKPEFEKYLIEKLVRFYNKSPIFVFWYFNPGSHQNHFRPGMPIYSYKESKNFQKLLALEHERHLRWYKCHLRWYTMVSSKKSDNFKGLFVIMVKLYVILRNIDMTNLVVGDDVDFSMLIDANT